jgi:hypothetical protein
MRRSTLSADSEDFNDAAEEGADEEEAEADAEGESMSEARMAQVLDSIDEEAEELELLKTTTSYEAEAETEAETDSEAAEALEQMRFTTRTQHQQNKQRKQRKQRAVQRRARVRGEPSMQDLMLLFQRVPTAISSLDSLSAQVAQLSATADHVLDFVTQVRFRCFLDVLF